MTSFNNKHGFSVIELLVVIALIGTIGSITALGSLSSYGHAISGNGVEIAESSLRQARNDSMAGICHSEACETNRGQRVWLENGLISLTDKEGLGIKSYPLEGAHASMPTEWLFVHGSGSTESAAQAVLSNQVSGWEAELTVSEAGMIDSQHRLP